jgi:glycosyltransferase involved in cell wall biosynthesis
VLIEAFRQGTPVVARRVGPFPEIIRSAQAGELFDSIPELLQALTRLQTDSAYRNTLATSGREAFARRWTESAVVPLYLETVSKALGQRDVRLGRVAAGTVRASGGAPISEGRQA